MKNALKLEVRNLGHVPSFKNNKMLARGMLITNPKNQKWMAKAVNSFVSQFTFAFQTEEAGTQTAQSRLLWTVSRLPLDDSLEWIGVVSGSWRRVNPGEEGASVVIEPL